MKLTCTKKDLIEALQIVSKAVSAKPQMPVLSGIYLKAANELLELQATDYELGMISRIPAAIEEPGEIVIVGRYFQEIIRKLPGENVTLTLKKDENIIHIQSDKANFTLLSMNASEFPVIQHYDGNLEFTIKNNVLCGLIKKTVFACATDDSRPVFTGCYLEVAGNTVTMAATNTHRLAVKSETFDKEIGNIKIIIPAKVLSEIMHIMVSDIPTDVRVVCSRNKISLFFENIYITSRLIEGAFPDYHRVIPKEFATDVTLKTEEFRAAVDRVSLISRANEYNVIRLEFSEGKVHISSNNPEIGHAQEDVPAVVHGPDVDIAFNSKYITDVLKNLEYNECKFSLNQSLSPTSIRETGDDTFIYVVTPVRTTAH